MFVTSFASLQQSGRAGAFLEFFQMLLASLRYKINLFREVRLHFDLHLNYC